MLQGIILKKISNFNYVQTADKKIYSCVSKGVFRYNNLNPVVGDNVIIQKLEGNNALITEILPRKNELYRPQIANIDQVGIIMSLKTPNFSSYLLNKYLALIEYKNLIPLLIFTKTDLISENDDAWIKIAWYQKVNYHIFLIDNRSFDKNQLESLKNILNNKVSVFIGQTGSGKSSTLNNLIGEEIIKTQEVSYALNRGKHTTTNNELHQINNGLVADTPGFSAFKLQELNRKNLSIAYRIFAEQIGKCKYRGCLHRDEPGCAIKLLVAEGKIANFFYQDYLKLLQELED